MLPVQIQRSNGLIVRIADIFVVGLLAVAFVSQFRFGQFKLEPGPVKLLVRSPPE